MKIDFTFKLFFLILLSILNRKSDQRLCFHSLDSAVPPLLTSKISGSIQATVQAGLCQNWSGTMQTSFLKPWLRLLIKTGMNRLIHIFSSPEPSGSQGELIVYPCSVVRPSVVHHFQRSSSLKQLGQSKPNFT